MRQQLTSHQSREVPRVAPTAAGISVRQSCLTKIPTVLALLMLILVIKEASIMKYYQSSEVPRVAPTAAGISVRRDPSLPASSSNTDWPALARRAATTDLKKV